MGFFGFIVLIVLILYLRGLSKRISVLEQNSKVYAESPAQKLKTTPISISDSNNKQEEHPTTTEKIKQEISERTITLKEKADIGERLIEWIKEDWLLKLGALLFLIGIGWFVSYAFANNWIGPMGRIVLGLIVGVLFMIGGEARTKNSTYQGSIFLVLGSSIVLLTIFADREIYQNFSSLAGLIIMFLSTAFVGLSSVRHKNEALAITSIVLAGIAPMLTNSASPDVISLFTYLTVVTVGTVWVVVLTGFRRLTFISLIIVFLYSLPIIGASQYKAHEDALLLFSFFFASIFFVTNSTGILKLKEKKDIIPDLLTAGLNGLFLVFMILNAAQENWQSLFLATWMLVFSIGAFMLFKVTKKPEVFFVHASIALGMLGVATAIELEGHALTIAYILEVSAISIIGYVLTKKADAGQALGLLLGIPAVLSISSLTSSAWRTEIFHKDFVVVLLMGIALLGVGLFYFSLRNNEQNKPKREYTKFFLTTGAYYLFALVWLSIHATELSNDTATMLSLVIYTLVGLALYFVGIGKNSHYVQWFGGVLLLLVVGRLILIDVWDMELTGRIITFFVIGTLLMSTAFMTKWTQKKNDAHTE